MLDTSLADADRFPLKLRDLVVCHLDSVNGPEKVVWRLPRSGSSATSRTRAFSLTASTAYGRRCPPGNVDREISDYTAVVDMSDAPTQQRAMALVNRGITLGQRSASDMEREVSHCGVVIGSPMRQ
jgi:hypothetical protein